MQEHDLSLLFVRPLNEFGIRYIICGSVAAILYGEPRLTHDVDLVAVTGGRFATTERLGDFPESRSP